MDSMLSISGYVLYALCLVATLALLSRYSRRRRLSLPPGPPSLPLIGNALQLAKTGQFLQFTEWSRIYGPILSLNLLGQHVIVLNSHKVAADLLDRRSNIYSDRPRFIVVYEYLSGGLLFSGAPYGDFWRRVRRTAHESLSIRAAPYVQPLQSKEAANLVLSLIEDSESWDEHMQRSSASAILSAVYGLPPVTSPTDPLISRIMAHMHRNVEYGQPGAHLVEIFPVLRLLPSWAARWKREAVYWYTEDTKLFEELLDYPRKAIMNEEPMNCFATTWIQNAHKNRLEWKETAWLAGTMFGAGVETTSAALSAFILAMTLHPRVLHKAQAEIDRVVGRDRVPSFEDKPDLPYIRAIVRETLRWWPVGPVGVPHRVMQDDSYDGYFIPKGSIIVYNVWAMNRDPTVYGPDFDTFRPERFLDVSGTTDVTPPDTHKQGHVTYGFGRRRCVGLNVANQSLFINIAFMIWALNIEAPRDSHNEPIMPSKTDWIDEGLIVRPRKFKCRIIPRSESVISLIKAAAH